MRPREAGKRVDFALMLPMLVPREVQNGLEEICSKFLWLAQVLKASAESQEGLLHKICCHFTITCEAVGEPVSGLSAARVQSI
jgi:hypothetical protein